MGKKRCSVVKALIAISTAAVLSAPAVLQAEYPGAPGARSVMVDDELFLGGNYIELGISAWGDFGTIGNRPAGFFGTAVRNNIGMSADHDGFNHGNENLNVDYFLPGAPFEIFAVGYRVGDTIERTLNYELGGRRNMPTVITDESEGDMLKARVISTWPGRMVVNQVISFRENQKFFRTEVTLENISGTDWDSARYFRTCDPDNTTDLIGDHTTDNTITHTMAEDGRAVVVAEMFQDHCPIFIAYGSRAPIFYYSTTPGAVASISPGWTENPYNPEVYETPFAKGTTMRGDYAIGINWDSGPLPAGHTSSPFVFYTSLDERDFDEIEDEISERIVSIPDEEVPAGVGSVAIEVNIDNVDNVAGFQFEITYDPDVLQIDSVTTGSLTGGWTIIANTLTDGLIIIGGVDGGMTPLEEIVSGSLVTLNFNVTGSPGDSCGLNFTGECKLVDDEGIALPALYEDGSFAIMEAVERTVSIPGDMVAITASSIQVPVNIDNANGVAGFQISVTYDAYVLEPTGVDTGSLTAGWMIMPNLTVPGEVSVAGANIPAITGDAGSLLLINFNVIGAPGDTTGLNLSEVLLSDEQGAPMFTGKLNGFLEVALIQHNLTISSTAGGSVTTPGEGTYTYFQGTVVDVVATAEATHNFTGWTGTAVDAGKVANPASAETTVTVDNDYTLIANFVALYSLDVISGYGAPVPSVGSHQYSEGTTVDASVDTPVAGDTDTRYVCTGWTGTGSVPDSGGTNETSFVMAEDSSITWHWKAQHRLTVNTEGEGSIALSPASSGNWYDEGIDVNIEALPEAGWAFSHWSGDASGIENPESVAMDGPKSVTAHFIERGFALIPAAAQVDMLFDDGTAKDTELAVGLSYTGGFDEPVNLSASVEPAAAGIDVWFTPHVVVPSGEMDISVMTVSLSADTRPDTYIITVTAESDTVTQTAGITLVANTLVYIPSPVYALAGVVEIPLNISNSAGLAGFQLTGVGDPTVFGQPEVVPGSLTEEWTILSYIPMPGKLNVAGFEPNNNELMGEAGSIAIMHAAVIGDIPEEGMPVVLEEVLLSDGQGNPIPHVVRDGILLKGMPGDINNDGVVNIFDVILCLRMSVGEDVTVEGVKYEHPYPEWLIRRADINGDGVANIFDVILILRKALDMEQGF